ncbi:MAG: CotH kinase family protein [Lachnospiraceae bacterium]|nr:CotH kinase family protein [Lachnospiraceae bacterium]
MKKYRIWKRRAVTACLVSLTLVLAGCGAGSGDTGSETTSVEKQLLTKTDNRALSEADTALSESVVTSGSDIGQSETGVTSAGTDNGQSKNGATSEAISADQNGNEKNKPDTTNDDVRADSIATENELNAETGMNTGTTGVEHKIVINEILSSNSMNMEHDGKFCDMIELANISDEDVDLSDYHLSDTLFDPMKAQLGGTIEKGGFAVFYCVGEGAELEKNELPFKISASGETLVLTKGAGNIVETVEVPELEKNVSYARKSTKNQIPQGQHETASGLIAAAGQGAGQSSNADRTGSDSFETGFEITGCVTMGADNVFRSTQTILPEVTPEDGTRAEEPLEIIFSPREGTEIFFTTDGSVPRESSGRYSKPLRITKTTTIRILVREASEQSGDGKAEETASYTFFVGEPAATLDDLCVGISASNLSSINAHPRSSTRYPASVAMYHEGSKVFDVTCGMNANGNTSAVYDKKSYRLKFSRKYGESRLHYKVFDDLDIDSFDSLVLRGGSQDNEDVMMKDELVPQILRQGGLVDEVLTTRYRPVNLYINGEYRGLYYIREHIDGPMIASHYGCDEEDVTVVEQCKEVKCGSAGKEWTDLWDFVAKNDLKEKEAYEHVASIVSLESVADYYVLQMWLHNIDPDNLRVYKAGDDKWRYAVYDLDLTLNDDGTDGPSFILGRYNKGLYTFNALVYKLLQNPEFMELYLSRMQLLYGTILSEEKVLPMIDAFVNRIDHDMERSCEMWGPRKDSSGGVYYVNYSTWERRVEKFKSRFVGRTARVAAEFVRLKGVSDELAEKYLKDIME